MSTTPTVPAATPAAIPGELSKISTYIKAHEKLIIIVLFIAAGIYAYQRAAGIVATYYSHKVDTDHAALLAQDDKDKAIAQMNAQAAAQYQVLATQLAQSNAALITAISTRDKATATQQAADRTLPPPALAQRWASLISMPAGIVPSSTGFTVTQPAAVETVVELEQMPQLKGDLQDTKALLLNEQTQFSSLAGLNVELNKQIDGLNINAGLAAKVCSDEKSQIKATARRSKLKYLLLGGAIVEGVKLYFFHTL